MWLIILIPAAFVFLVLLISCLIGVPCLSTHQKQAELMIELGEIKTGMKVVDLGSGMGRLLFLDTVRFRVFKKLFSWLQYAKIWSFN
jgi:hypothetical protein